MSQPQNRISDHVATAQDAAAGAAARYDEIVNATGAAVITGIRTGNWSGFEFTFGLLQEAATNALNRRRSALFAGRMFGGAR